MEKKENLQTLRRQPKQKRGQVRVQNILDAAEKLMLEHGYDALNTNAIAANAGISIGSLYHFFPNKLAILEALIERYYQQFLDVLAQVHVFEEEHLLTASAYIALLFNRLAKFERESAAAIPAFMAASNVTLEKVDSDYKSRTLNLLSNFYHAYGLKQDQAFEVARVVLLVIDGFLIETIEESDQSKRSLTLELQKMLTVYLIPYWDNEK